MDEVNDNSCRRCNPTCPKNCDDCEREAYEWYLEDLESGHLLPND